MTELCEATLNDTEHLIEMMRGLWTTPTSTFNEALSRKCLAAMLQDRSLGRVWLINGGEGFLVLTFGFSLEFGRDALSTNSLLPRLTATKAWAPRCWI